MTDFYIIEVWSESKADWVPTGNVGSLRECRRVLRTLTNKFPRRRRISRYVRTAAIE